MAGGWDACLLLYQKDYSAYNLRKRLCDGPAIIKTVFVRAGESVLVAHREGDIHRYALKGGELKKETTSKVGPNLLAMAAAEDG